MTPQDKVTQLMQKFYHFNTKGETPQPITKEEAKELSLFVANQVIEQEAQYGGFGTFWKQVKKELEEL